MSTSEKLPRTGSGRSPAGKLGAFHRPNRNFTSLTDLRIWVNSDDHKLGTILEVLDTLNHLGIEFVSFQENLDTGGPLGRPVVVIVSAVAELERNLIIERL